MPDIVDQTHRITENGQCRQRPYSKCENNRMKMSPAGNESNNIGMFMCILNMLQLLYSLRRTCFMLSSVDKTQFQWSFILEISAHSYLQSMSRLILIQNPISIYACVLLLNRFVTI